MGIKDFFLKKMIESKMKDMPKEEQEKVLAMIQKNPDLFKKIAEEIKNEVDGGKSEMDAAMLIMSKYQDDLKKIADN